MNGYELSRKWFDFCFDNPEKIKPYHSAIYFFAIEHCNRLGWKKKFGFPTTMAMEATGIKSYSSYKRYFDDLVEWGFFEILEYSKNQYSANIIALSSKAKATTKALDKATSKHGIKQSQSNYKSIDSIDKPINLKTNKPINIEFNVFWNLYDKKIGAKSKCETKWNKLSDETRVKIIETLPAFKSSIKDIQYIPYPETYLNNERWNDEISIIPQPSRFVQ